jgi:hypothetical protein
MLECTYNCRGIFGYFIIWAQIIFAMVTQKSVTTGLAVFPCTHQLHIQNLFWTGLYKFTETKSCAVFMESVCLAQMKTPPEGGVKVIKGVLVNPP